MGVLDGGVARVFGSAFGALYPEAMLHLKLRAGEDAGGSVVRAFTGDTGQLPGTPCKAQRDAAGFTMRQVEGYAEGDVRFLILTRYGETGLPDIPLGSHITWPWPDGTRYSLEGPVELDAAGSHYVARGREVPNG